MSYPIQTIDAETLSPVVALFDKGLYMQAYDLANQFGPLQNWRGAAGRVVAGRLSLALGAARMGRILHRLAGREHPEDADAVLYTAYALLAQQGPWMASQWLKSHKTIFVSGTPGRHSDMLSLSARLMAMLRDFSEAEKLLSEAETIAPESAWVQLERSNFCELADDYDGALAAVLRALSLRESYRPAIAQHANILTLLGRDDEALVVLEAGAANLESGSLCASLFDLQMEREQYREAETTLSRIEKLSPLGDKPHRKWMNGRLADVRYHLDDREGAARHARLAGGGFYERLAERMEQAELKERRVLLDVGFIRQHHMTCVPATLSALTRYWQRPVEQLSIAEAICYDGTSDQAGRAWAEGAGWHVREFTVTWESAVTLLDRGIPFTLSTVEPCSAHMQAVVGYDNVRGSFLIRDPYQRELQEFAAEPMLERYCANGPRGMVLLPQPEIPRLDGIELPDAELYDEYHGLQTALLCHDRARAVELVAAMKLRTPDHRMTLFAQRSLASYDGDEAGRLRVTDALLALFPEDVNFRLSRQNLLYRLGRREQCLEYLDAQCNGPASHPLLHLSYADLLRDDARELDHARRLLRRVLLQMPLRAEVYYKQAHILWDMRQYAEALELYRAALSLDITDERYAESYFKAARYLKLADAALELLTYRFERWGRKSAQPVMTLFEAYDALEQTQKGLEALELALDWRSQDGDLLLYAAEAWGRNGNMTRAEELLVRAEPLARRASWLQSKARLSEGRASLEEALVYWEQLAQDDPFNLRAVRSVARLRTDTQSPKAAIDYLEELATRFPHHHGLNRLYVEWLKDAEAEIVEAALRRVLEINPTDAWSWRQLALNLSGQRKSQEAFAALEQAHKLAPFESAYHTTHAWLLTDSGRNEEARTALREALRISIDNDSAIDSLLGHCSNITDRRNELAFIHAELMRQVTYGDGLLSFREAAHNVLDEHELLEKLSSAKQQRPDLWHAWVAVARQLRDMGELDQALSVIKEAAERFPLLPRVWVDKAQIEHRRANTEGQEAALRAALEIVPSWSLPTRSLAELYQGQGRFDDARVLLSQALRHNPRDGITYGWLADVLWLLGERDAALDNLEQSLRLEPGYLWAWGRLKRFSKEHGQNHRPLALAQSLTETQPRNANTWLLLARAQTKLPDALAAVERALQVDRRSQRAHELRVDLLLDHGDYKAALEATQDEAWHGNVPAALRLRRARILAQQGDEDEALNTLQSLLAAEPDYKEAWEQLATWHDEADRQPEHLKAAREMVRLDPGNNISHGFVADALLKNGKRAEAKQSLRHALELDPSYVWAFNTLFNLELDDNELESAGQLLPMIVTHETVANAALAKLRHAAASRSRAEVVAAFEALAATDSDNDEVFDRAVAVFEKDGELEVLDELLDRLIERDDSNPQIGRLWVERNARRRRWTHIVNKFDNLFARGAIGRSAAAAYLRKLAHNKQRNLLNSFLRKHETMLRTDAETWGLGGFALLTAELAPQCVNWLHDWRERPDAAPWMLLNLALALRDLGRREEARAVSEHALSLDTNDSSDQHKLMLAVDAGLAGDIQKLAQLLKDIDSSDTGTYYNYLHELALALRIALQPGDNPGSAYRKASEHFLRSAALLPFTSEKFLLYAQQRTLWKIAQARSPVLPLTLFWFAWGYLMLIPYLIRNKTG